MSEGGVDRQQGRRPFVPRRRQALCVIAAGTRRDPARLREVSAAGATLDTNGRPPLGEAVELQHPAAGTIVARVARHTRDGIGLSFDLGADAIAFALRALAADMAA